MMTEDEAKTKWCHAIHARMLGEIRYPGGDVPPSVRCIGSACMAWRWLPPLYIVDGRPGSIAVVDEGAKATGFCGLGGSPA